MWKRAVHPAPPLTQSLTRDPKTGANLCGFRDLKRSTWWSVIVVQVQVEKRRSRHGKHLAQFGAMTRSGRTMGSQEWPPLVQDGGIWYISMVGPPSQYSALCPSCSSSFAAQSPEFIALRLYRYGQACSCYRQWSTIGLV